MSGMHIDSGSNATVKMPASVIGAKMKSKNEVYRFLASEVRAYLSSYETMTVYHLRDLFSGQKKLILAEEVKHISVPFFEGLKIEEMLKFAFSYEEVFKRLPVEKEILQLPRQYIANVIYTIVGKPFSNWVDLKIAERHQKVTSEKNMMVELDPAIAKILQKSTIVSSKYTLISALCIYLIILSYLCSREGKQSQLVKDYHKEKTIKATDQG